MSNPNGNVVYREFPLSIIQLTVHGLNHTRVVCYGLLFMVLIQLLAFLYRITTFNVFFICKSLCCWSVTKKLRIRKNNKFINGQQIFLRYYIGKGRHCYSWNFIINLMLEFYLMCWKGKNLSSLSTLSSHLIIPLIQRSWMGYTGSTLSVRLSVRLWTESGPLCTFYNIRRIHFIFTHLIKHL